MKTILVLLAVAVTTLAQTPPAPCDAPKNWEAHAMFFDSDKHEETRARIYYDATTEGKERIRINDYVEEGQQKTAMERLLLWEEKKEYQYDIDTKKCVTTDLTQPFKPIGVPADGKYVNTISIGLYSAMGDNPSGIKCHVYSVEEKEPTPGGEANMYVAVTEELCIPVNDYLVFRKGTVLDVHRANFFNITTPIKDSTTIFTPPTACNQ